MEQEVTKEVTEAIENEETPLTFDEVLGVKEYQKEFDRRIGKALETAKAKWEQEAEAKRSEADKLAKMKDDEKRAYELNKANQERDDALAKLNAYQLREQASRIATEMGVDTSLLDLLNFNSIKAEDVEPAIGRLKEVMDKAIERNISERMKESTPKTVASVQTTNTSNMPKFF